MKNLLRMLPVLAVAALLAGCEGPCSKIGGINAPALTSGSADFSVVAAAGTSISAGYQSGGLVDRHQMRAFPAMFAQQTGHTVNATGTGDFTFDGINGDGLPVLLALQSLSPLVISNSGRTPGSPQNTTQPTPYHNLAVPGQLASDMLSNARYAGGLFPAIYRGTTLGWKQLAGRAPTFITYEFGANEVLGTATAGFAPNPLLVASFEPSLNATLDSLHLALPNAKIAVFTVPNVSAAPFFTTFSPVTVDLTTKTPVALRVLVNGVNTAMSPTDLVLLTAKDSLAAGTGFPVGSYNYLNPLAPGNGRPLLDSQVLSSAEAVETSDAVSAMNLAVDTYVAEHPWCVKVDLYALLNDIAANGYTVGSTTYTSAFVTGGLFSLDGVHPTDLAHALICNTLIDAVNAKWGSTVPKLALAQYATATSSSLRPATGGTSLDGLRIDGLQDGLNLLFPKH